MLLNTKIKTLPNASIEESQEICKVKIEKNVWAVELRARFIRSPKHWIFHSFIMQMALSKWILSFIDLTRILVKYVLGNSVVKTIEQGFLCRQATSSYYLSIHFRFFSISVSPKPSGPNNTLLSGKISHLCENEVAKFGNWSDSQYKFCCERLIWMT